MPPGRTAPQGVPDQGAQGSRNHEGVRAEARHQTMKTPRKIAEEVIDAYARRLHIKNHASLAWLESHIAGALEARDQEHHAKLEEVLTPFCCHTSGMHDPSHFEERKHVCRDQMADAYARTCSTFGINPKTKSNPNCGWCRDYPEKKRGEGLRAFKSLEPCAGCGASCNHVEKKCCGSSWCHWCFEREHKEVCKKT